MSHHSFALILQTLNNNNNSNKGYSDSKINSGQVKKGGGVGKREPKNLSPLGTNQPSDSRYLHWLSLFLPLTVS